MLNGYKVEVATEFCLTNSDADPAKPIGKLSKVRVDRMVHCTVDWSLHSHMQR